MAENRQRSGFVNQIEEAQRASQLKRAMVKEITDICWNLSVDALPPIDFMNNIGSDTPNHFKTEMVSFFTEFVMRFNLRPESHVLDIGSGCGRLGLPFSLFLRDGKYYGVDVWKDGVEWCKNRISPSNQNVQFHLLHAANNYYIEDYDPTVQNQYILDFIPNESLDFAFGISVFTHLTRNDSQSYLNELGRALSIHGAAFLTCFIIDDFFFQHVERSGRHKDVKRLDTSGFYQAYKGQDFFGGYTRELWEEMLAQAGLRTISYELGSWASKPGARVYQDTFIVMRAK